MKSNWKTQIISVLFGERKDEDKEKIDACFGHTFVVKTLGCVFQSIQKKTKYVTLH